MHYAQPKLPHGFFELTPQWQIVFNHMVRVIQYLLEEEGFCPISTAGLELWSVQSTRDDRVDQYFRFINDKTELCLPVELTGPLSRYLVQHESATVFPFYCYQIAKTYQANAQDRERYLCDMNIIGTRGSSEGQLPAIVNRMLEHLGLDTFVIRINNRRLLKCTLNELGLSHPDQLRAVKQVVHANAGADVHLLVEQLAKQGIGKYSGRKIADFVAMSGQAVHERPCRAIR